jgi:hypothetical protein
MLWKRIIYIFSNFLNIDYSGSDCCSSNVQGEEVSSSSRPEKPEIRSFKYKRGLNPLGRLLLELKEEDKYKDWMEGMYH